MQHGPPIADRQTLSDGAGDPAALITLATDLRASRDRAVAWLLARIGIDGEVMGSSTRNGWARVPWALAVAGETEAAARVLAWADRFGVAPDGDFREGPSLGDGMFRAYPLAHLAIGAHLGGRHDLALRIMGALGKMQLPETAGTCMGMTGPTGEYQDLLFTAQAGLAALITGQHEFADGVYQWIVQLWRDQPNLPLQLYCMRSGKELVIEPDPKMALMAITDFTKPQQLYYNPSIAAVFLAKYAAMRGDSKALRLGHAFLQLNIHSPVDQYNDPASVQICKFGWAAAAMMLADPDCDYTEHLVRMGRWFMARQAADGSWSPSTFMFPQPTDVDRMLKTAEHAMEIDVMMSAIGMKLGSAK